MSKKLLGMGVALALLGSAGVAQKGYLTGFSTSKVWTVDPTTCTVQTCRTGTSESSGGITVGYDRAIYMSAWSTNGFLRIDPVQCTTTTICSDRTNRVLGSPYDPAVNNEAVGGPGLWVVDGNSAPSPAPSGSRNTALVDILGGTCVMDCWFPDTGPGSKPKSFAVNDPQSCGKFIGVGYSTKDMYVTRYELGNGKPGPCVTTTICKMREPSVWDAFLGEDCAIYVWNSSRYGNVGFTRVDTQTGSCTTCSIGIPHAGPNAGVWADPPEVPGNRAYVANADGKIYTVDMDKCAVVTICRSGLTSVTNAQSVEENELTSWLNKDGTRTFNINFGSSVPSNALFVLVPSIIRDCKAPLIAGGYEIWFTPDVYTFLGLGSALPYTPIGTLSGGAAQSIWRLPLLGYNGAYWIAMAFDARTNKLLNVSNVIKLCI